MQEIWKDIEGYEGLYQVSNLGNVRKTRGKILKQRPNNIGYSTVALYKKSKIKIFLVHRLVAINFLENLNNYPQVNHIDGNKYNNNTNNLEWCTRDYNMQHAFNTGLCKKRYCGDNNNAQKVNQYDLAENLIKEWDCIKSAANSVGTHRNSITRCCNGTFKTCKGFIWRYAD